MKISFIHAKDLLPDMVIFSGFMDGDMTVIKVKPVKKKYIEVTVRTENMTEETRMYTLDATVPVFPKNNAI